MLDTSADENNSCWQVYHIHIEDMQHQEHGYFGLIGIVNFVNQVLPNALVVSVLHNLANNAQ